MLSEEQASGVDFRTLLSAGPIVGSPEHGQSPLVVNPNFIFTDSRVAQRFQTEGRAGTGAGEFVQPRWEDAGRSTNAERGSVESNSNDVNLVLASTEYRDGLVIKRFREFQRVDGEAETKSISNRSVISESSRLHSVSFRPLRPVEEMDDQSQVSLTKEGMQQLDDTKSEQLFLVPSSHWKEPAPIGFVAHKIQFGQKPVDDLASELRVNGLAPRNSRKRLETLPLTSNGGGNAKQAHGPLSTDRTISDPVIAAELIRGEIAEADLVLENWGRFEGELVDGKMNGYGRLYDQHNRLLFEGDFVDNEYEGVGILYNQAMEKNYLTFDDTGASGFDWNSIGNRWVKYEGLFKSGRFHGRGYLHLGGSQVVATDFSEGKPGDEVLLRDLASQKTQRLQGKRLGSARTG
jgi:hypothetical protein